MAALLLIAIALILPQEKNEAEALFKKVEEKLVNAKTVRLKLSGEIQPVKMTLAGEMVLGEESRLRAELEGKMGDKAVKAALVSDGRRLRLESSDKPAPLVLDVPVTLGRLSRICLARGGFFGVTDILDNQKSLQADADDLVSVSDFKLWVKEKVGDREAQSVQYKLVQKGFAPAEATLWIDIETHLPLKRVIKKGGMTLSELYSEVKLDEKFDAARFELPKETK